MIYQVSSSESLKYQPVIKIWLNKIQFSGTTFEFSKLLLIFLIILILNSGRVNIWWFNIQNMLKLTNLFTKVFPCWTFHYTVTVLKSAPAVHYTVSIKWLSFIPNVFPAHTYGLSHMHKPALIIMYIQVMYGCIWCMKATELRYGFSPLMYCHMRTFYVTILLVLNVIIN